MVCDVQCAVCCTSEGGERRRRDEARRGEKRREGARRGGVRCAAYSYRCGSPPSLLRYCYLVVKGGAIVHEKYFANSSDTKYETDSAAKTMIAALIGAVHRHRPWDIDRPIVEYGVERRERSLYDVLYAVCMLYGVERRERNLPCTVMLYSLLCGLYCGA